jgi:hypothetical protein
MDIDPSRCPPGHGKYYIADNYVFGYDDVTADNWKGVVLDKTVALDSCKILQAYATTAITTQTALDAFETVLSSAGASFKRDAIDNRIVKEVKSGKATYNGSVDKLPGIIDSQNDVGGWLIYKSKKAPVDTNADGVPDKWLKKNYKDKLASEIASNGYSYLEIYLNSLIK